MSIQNPKIQALRAEGGTPAALGGAKGNEKTPLIRRDSVAHLGEIEGSEAEGFGEKTIGFFGGFSLTANNVSGPGCVAIPVLFQQAGWLTPTIALIMFTVIGTFAGTMLIEAMARVPGNQSFDKRIELTSVAHYFLPHWGYHLTQFLMVFSLQSVNISSIIVSAQTMDLTLIAIFGKTCGLELYPEFRGVCPDAPGKDISPFGPVFVISLGFLVVMVLILPFGYFNLDDSIILQSVSFVVLCTILTIWTVDFCLSGLHFDRVPMIGDSQYSVLGTIMFNYAFVTSVPSWVNEKKPEVSIQKTMWGGVTLSTGMFLVMGFFGGWALTFTGNQDMLDGVASAHGPLRLASQVSVYVFPAVVLLSSIPVFSIIVRYNLIENKICNKFWANMFANVFPWVVSVPFYTGSGLTEIINWSSLFVNGVVNFIIPLWIYIESRKAVDAQRNVSLADMSTAASEKPSVEEEVDFEAIPQNMQEALPWLDGQTMASVFMWLLIVLTVVVIIIDVVMTALGHNVV